MALSETPMVYSVRLTPEQKLAAKLPIMITSRGAAAVAMRNAEVVFNAIVPASMDGGVRAEEFPIMYASGGRYLPDLRQAETVPVEILEAHRIRREATMAKAMKMPDLEKDPEPEPVKFVPKEPSLHTRFNKRVVYVQRSFKKWGRK